MKINQKTSEKLPEEFTKYFWDCDFSEITFEKYPRYICERILNFGDLNSIKWLFTKINKNQLKDYIKSSRKLNKKTKNFWEIMLNPL